MLDFLYHGIYHDGSGFLRASTLFGTRSAASVTSTLPTRPLFGTAVPTPPPPALFGAAAPAPTPPLPSLFGVVVPVPPPASSSLLGSSTQSTPSLFGPRNFGGQTSIPSTRSSNSSFGVTSSQPGNTPNTQNLFSNSSSSLFGSSSSQNSTSTTNTTSLPHGSAQSIPLFNAVKAEALITNAKVYIIAEQYDIQPLKHLAKKKYQDIIPATWNSSSFVESLRIIYDGTPDSSQVDMLRELALNTAGRHAKELMDRGEFLTLCKDRGEISVEVLKASLNVEKSLQPPSAASQMFKCAINQSHAVTTRSYGSENRPSYWCTICHTILGS